VISQKFFSIFILDTEIDSKSMYGQTKEFEESKELGKKRTKMRGSHGFNKYFQSYRSQNNVALMKV
jgi:hypothetical protein